jgi:flavin-dependent dehydrogenase
MTDPIAIVGASVAGSWLAERLTRAGHPVLLFDFRAPWEKPCGGGLTPQLLRRYPEIAALDPERREHRRMEYQFPSGRRVSLSLAEPMVTIGRQRLNRALLDRAVAAGAEFVRAKVEAIRREGGGVVVVAEGREWRGRLVVGADGALSLVRRTFLSPFPREDLCLAFGLLLPVEVKLPVVIRFFPGFDGYAWIFPRRGQTSAGIALEGGGARREELVRTLFAFVRAEWRRAGLTPPELPRPWAWMLPALRFQTFAEARVQGEGFALVGDASGAADPVTGEGIYYALRTADLLADAIVAGRPESYRQAWIDLTKVSIGRVSSMRPRFYRPSTQRLLPLMLDYSPGCRRLVRELTAGLQSYDTLKPRVLDNWRALAREAIINLVLFRRGERPGEIDG